MLQSVIEYYRVLQSIAKYYRVLQNITEYYRVFLAHLLGPIFGLVVGEKTKKYDIKLAVVVAYLIRLILGKLTVAVET